MATAEKILEIARSQIGTKESPAKSDNVKYNTAYYGRAVSGCLLYTSLRESVDRKAPRVRKAIRASRESKDLKETRENPAHKDPPE